MASYYESETSGYNPDRFTGDLEAKESTFTKIKGTYWKTKQILCDKLGLPSDDGGGQNATEDDHEFDKLLTNFRAIEGSTKQLEDNFRKHHKNIGETSNSEQELAKFLEFESHSEKEHLKAIMKATGSALSTMSKERARLLWPVARLQHELSMFYERAVEDCAETVEAAKNSRNDYRGSLLWMKSIKHVDPENSHDRGMDELRLAQQAFKKARGRFDQLVDDLGYKVDLLASSRSKLLVDLAKEYAHSLMAFHEATCKGLDELPDLPDANTYEIDIDKVLKKATASFTSISHEESPLERVVQQQQEKEEKPEECVNLITMDEVDEVGNEFISSFEQFLAESTAQSSSAAPSGLEHDDELSGLFDDYAQHQDGTERENEHSQQDPVDASKPTLIDFE